MSTRWAEATRTAAGLSSEKAMALANGVQHRDPRFEALVTEVKRRVEAAH